MPWSSTHKIAASALILVRSTEDRSTAAGGTAAGRIGRSGTGVGLEDGGLLPENCQEFHV